VQSLIKFPFRTITIVLIISISILSSELYAQNSLRIFDVPGGSGGSTTQSDDSNDDTFLYVAGGLIIAGILVYALVIKKDKKTEEDTTASLKSNLILSEANDFNSPEEVQKIKDIIPVDLFLGIRNNEAVMNDKTYLLGFRVKL
jgi:hypothetical protein